MFDLVVFCLGTLLIFIALSLLGIVMCLPLLLLEIGLKSTTAYGVFLGGALTIYTVFFK